MIVKATFAGKVGVLTSGGQSLYTLKSEVTLRASQGDLAENERESNKGKMITCIRGLGLKMESPLCSGLSLILHSLRVYSPFLI